MLPDAINGSSGGSMLSLAFIAFDGSFGGSMTPPRDRRAHCQPASNMAGLTMWVEQLQCVKGFEDVRRFPLACVLQGEACAWGGRHSRCSSQLALQRVHRLCSWDATPVVALRWRDKIGPNVLGGRHSLCSAQLV